jgi:glycosyltransferase involved in cell wall biosynthesis
MPIKGKHLLQYLPHGINPKVFKPIHKTDPKLIEMKKKMFGNKSYDFVVFYNSRNINRKRTAQLMLAFRAFCDNLTKEQASKCALVLHTEKILDAGTDLPVVHSALSPDYTIVVTEDKFLPEAMNLLYNLADVTANISSNEGFGLSCGESIMAGVPVIVNVTGGLQDQIGQIDDDGKPVEFDYNFGTNNVGKYKKCGVWAKPVWPSTRYIQGSPPTPYIFDDVCKWEDVAEAIMYWYLMPKEQREKCGLEGRRWALNEGNINAPHMCEEFIKGMDYTLENFEPTTRFSLHTNAEHVGHKMPFDSMGFDIPKINTEEIEKQIKEIKI